jgi:hypothetical protein
MNITTLLPEREGQPMTIELPRNALGEDRQSGCWYSPAAVREMLDAQRAVEKTSLRCALEALDECAASLADLLARCPSSCDGYREYDRRARTDALQRHRKIAEQLRARLG